MLLQGNGNRCNKQPWHLLDGAMSPAADTRLQLVSPRGLQHDTVMYTGVWPPTHTAAGRGNAALAHVLECFDHLSSFNYLSQILSGSY